MILQPHREKPSHRCGTSSWGRGAKSAHSQDSRSSALTRRKAPLRKYTAIAIVLAEEENDASHSLVKGYQAHNDQVAEELAKVVIDTYPAKP
jgi:hypothetical protein